MEQRADWINNFQTLLHGTLEILQSTPPVGRGIELQEESADWARVLSPPSTESQVPYFHWSASSSIFFSLELPHNILFEQRKVWLKKCLKLLD